MPPSQNGEVTHNSPATEQGGRRWRRRTGDIQGVFYAVTKVGGVPDRRITKKGEQPREA